MTSSTPTTHPTVHASPEVRDTRVAGAPVALTTRMSTPPAESAAADVWATDLDWLRRAADAATDHDVDRALRRPRPGSADLAALLSDAAERRLEELAQRAHEVTTRRFGRTVHLFAPLYVSNECVSECTYCGFSATNRIVRRTLTIDEVVAEARSLVDAGHRHLLLVAGEHARIVSKDYLVDIVAALAPFVPQLSLEVQVWDIETYRRLVDAGCDGLVVYQETYDPSVYDAVHLKGKKRNAAWRMHACDRGAEAGMRRLGVGALLGLATDWKREVLGVGVHAAALVRRQWRSEVTVALPRMQPAAGEPEPALVVDDRSFTQAIAALRIALPDVGLVLSTREPPALRDALVRIGVTHLSAGSHTEPGGYTSATDAEPQFEIHDTRSPAEVASMLHSANLDPVWKDWQRS